MENDRKRSKEVTGKLDKKPAARPGGSVAGRVPTVATGDGFQSSNPSEDDTQTGSPGAEADRGRAERD
jgi:hypothetical protein